MADSTYDKLLALAREAQQQATMNIFGALQEFADGKPNTLAKKDVAETILDRIWPEIKKLLELEHERGLLDAAANRVFDD